VTNKEFQEKLALYPPDIELYFQTTTLTKQEFDLYFIINPKDRIDGDDRMCIYLMEL